MPVMCLHPSERHHVTTGILAQAERSWGESLAYVNLWHLCALTSRPAAQLAHMR